MASEEFDEDSIDTGALQAQIDLSMSYAQNLVASWMEPSHLLTSTRSKDLEKELQETMKRPPRLGVGASASEGMQSLTREAARLKGKLAGSKRSREELDERPKNQPPSDDEDDSRSGAISKKARPDPFATIHGKKKNKQNSGIILPVKKELSTSTPPPPSHPLTNSSSPSGESRQNGSPPEVNRSTTKKKKKKSKGLLEPGNTREAPSIECPALVAAAPERDELPSLQGESQPAASPKYLQVQPPTKVPHATDTPSTETDASHFFHAPLLNLDGPPLSDADSDNPGHSPTTSPKKRRKRKKKKKNRPITNVGEGATETSNTIS